EMTQLEHLRHRALHQAEWVDVSEQMTAVRVDLHEARDAALLCGHVGRRRRSRGRRKYRLASSSFSERLADRLVRRHHPAGAKAGEVVAPLKRNGAWIFQVLFVERFDVRSVGGPEGRRV